MRKKNGFTLIELLIVVAIIAILAAIAVPNFLEAQVRAKVTREKSDLRTQAIAIEAYMVDYGKYPRDSDSSLDMKDSNGVSMDMSRPDWGLWCNGAQSLTTPVAYMSTLLADPFVREVAVEGAGAVGYRIASGSWSYASDSQNPQDNQGSARVMQTVGPRACYAIIAVGPDGARSRNAYKCFPFMSLYEGGASTDPRPNKGDGQPRMWVNYDPTNGTVSKGDVYRFGGNFNEGRFMMDGAVVGAQSSPGGNVW